MGTTDPQMLQCLQKQKQSLYQHILSGKEQPRSLRPTLLMQTLRWEEASEAEKASLQRTVSWSCMNSKESAAQ